MSGTFGVILVISVVIFLAAGCTTQHAADRELRVMSFNIRCATAPDGPNVWDNRREMFVQTVRAFDPDIFGSQEVVGVQPRDLREAFPDFTYVGVGRSDGKEAGEASPIMFRTSRFELVSSGRFWLSETPEVPGSKSWDAAITRIATWVRLRDRDRKAMEFLVINTHWDHAGAVARLRSGELIQSRLPGLAGGAAVIVMGDFNCTEDDAPYRAIGMTDSYRQVHPQRTTDEATFHAFKGTTAGSRIDFILYDGPWQVTEANIVRNSREDKYPSDHFAVTAVLR